jgi:hypothetical protein
MGDRAATAAAAAAKDLNGECASGARVPGPAVEPSLEAGTKTGAGSGADSPAAPRPYSLASRSSWQLSACVSALVLLGHGLLLWGQLAALWGAGVYMRVNVTVSGPPYVTNPALQMLGLDSLGSLNKTVSKSESRVLETFTYGQSIYELWIEHLPLTYVSAVLLVLFSAVWPHLKLVLLHVYFYCAFRSGPRRAALYWLGSLGKLSLADVCLVCFMFVVLNISQELSAANIYALGLSFVPDLAAAFRAAHAGLGPRIESLVANATYTHLGDLSNYIFEGNHTGLYDEALARGCGVYAGKTCPVQLYTPSRIFGGMAGVVAKCAAVSGFNKCNRCECIANNLLFNGDVPEAGVDKAVATAFAKGLVLARDLASGALRAVQVEGTVESGLEAYAFPGIVAFCIGVIVSIIASIVVDHIDERSTARDFEIDCFAAALKRVGRQASARSWLLLASDSDSGGRGALGAARKAAVAIALVGVVPLAVAAVCVPMYSWQIGGLLPSLIDLNATASPLYGETPGIVFTQLLSNIDMVTRVGLTGDPTRQLFMVLFGCFLIGVPLLRAALLLVVGALPLRPAQQLRLAQISNHVGGFSAWEPLILCLVLIEVELPSLLRNAVDPAECAAISTNFFIARLISTYGLYDSYCFVMYFSLKPPVAILAFAWILLVSLNTLTWSAVLRAYEPYGPSGDKGAPYCHCATCCSGPCGSKPGRRGCCGDCDAERAAAPVLEVKQLSQVPSSEGSSSQGGKSQGGSSGSGKISLGDSSAVAQV